MIRRGAPLPLPAASELAAFPFARLRVTIVGLGRFGGGAGAARFFAERGAHVTVTDLRGADELADSLAPLARLPIKRYRLGEHRDEDLAEADWIVLNPAVPPDAEVVSRVRATRAHVVSEIGLFLRWCPTTWTAGITGSNGKSTTSQLCADALEASGLRVHLGGNIGRSLLPDLSVIRAEDRVVLELSSFQLARLDPALPLPRAVAITQFAPGNHLDWHADALDYQTAKERIFAAAPSPGRPELGHAGSNSRQPVDSWAWLPADDPRRERWLTMASEAGRRVGIFTGDTLPSLPADCERSIGVCDRTLLARVGWGSGQTSAEDTPLLPLEDLLLRGPENRGNLACAAGLALCLGATPAGIASAARAFRGLEHRQQFLGERHGVRFVNDSKATTPEALACALRAWGPNVVLLAGGRFKGHSFDPVVEAVRGQTRAIVLFGECRQRWADALQAARIAPAPICCPSLELAFPVAVAAAGPGTTVLLSPACASLDQFADFRARGSLFQALVESHLRDDG